MQNIKTFFKNLWRDESAQGTAEYVLLLVVVIAVVMLFRDKIRGALEGKLQQTGESISNFSGEGG